LPFGGEKAWVIVIGRLYFINLLKGYFVFREVAQPGLAHLHGVAKKPKSKSPRKQKKSKKTQ